MIELSETLNKLRAAEVRDAQTFRNPNGTAMKLHNFGRFEGNRASLSNGGQGEEAIWKEFSGDRDSLRRLAQALKVNLA